MKLKQTTRPALAPAAIYLLMLGRFVPSYLPGWAGLHWEMTPFAHDPEAWRASVMTPEIAAWLEAEAAAHGFRPWALTGRGPRGAGVAAWEGAFLAEHGRHD
jgi:hypothetical protein